MHKPKCWQYWVFTGAEIAAVLALLATIPVSAYVRVKEKAYQTQCASQLRTIGQALMLYVDEQGNYPKAKFFPEKGKQDPQSLISILQNYGAQPGKVWLCPSLPEGFHVYGSTFLYNDSIGGTRSVPPDTWVLIEITCLNKNLPYPHPDGFNILYADGSVKTTKELPSDLARYLEIRKAQ